MTNVAPNKTVTFNFDPSVGSVINAVVGISYFTFGFSGSDHHVKTFQLSVKSYASGLQVIATINAHLMDGSGADISATVSHIDLVCIAVVTAANDQFALGTSYGVQSGTSAGSVAVDWSQSSISQAFPCGWNLTYPGTSDHHIKKVQVGATFNVSNPYDQATAFAQMQDGSGNLASGTVDASILVANSSQSTLLAQLAPSLQTSAATTLQFGKPLHACGAVIQSYTVSYPSDDHHVLNIGAGTTGCSLDRSGTAVVLANARAFVSDGSGNHQSDSLSNVSFVVFAIA